MSFHENIKAKNSRVPLAIMQPSLQTKWNPGLFRPLPLYRHPVDAGKPYNNSSDPHILEL